MFPRTSNSTCPAASPCTRLSRAPSTTNGSDFHRRLCVPQDGPFGQHTQSIQQTKTAVDLPGAMTLPFLSMPCSQTPPESPVTIAFSGHLLLPSRFSTLSASGCVTRLYRFTCVTAWTSLCLRLTHVVTFMSPRLDSRWGGSSPFPGRESHPLKTPGLTWRTEESLQVHIDHHPSTFGNKLLGRLDRLVGIPSRPKAVARFREVRFEDR